MTNKDYKYYLCIFFKIIIYAIIYMTTKTLSAYQYKSLITKSKMGWAAFYQAQQENHRLQESHYQQMLTLESRLERVVKIKEEEVIPEFVMSEMRDMIGELKKEIECPICYEVLEADKIKFSSCGHKYCETCLSKIDECSICRKKIYKKKLISK